MALNTVKKDRSKRRRGLFLVIVIVLVLCGFLSYKRVELEKQQKKVHEQYETAVENRDAEEERKEDLEEFKIYSQTKKYVEDIAREKFGLVYEDEVVLEPEE